MGSSVRWRGALPIAVSLAAAFALSACGVAGSEPIDLGDAYAPNVVSNAISPAVPNASNPDLLVDGFLSAAAGGGETGANQALAFLTDDGKKQWRPAKDEPITIIHISSRVQGPGGETGIPVTLSYQVIGTLGDGLVTPASGGQKGTMVFGVVKAPDRFDQLRINSLNGMPARLVLTDEALGIYYRQQPIYFWDKSNAVLVPDLRYVPLTQTLDQRANAILNWIIQGASPLLGEVNRPTNVFPSPGVTVRDSTLVVKLSPQAGPAGSDDLNRLYWQLQASLLSGTQYQYQLELIVGATQVASLGQDRYKNFDLSSAMAPPLQRYDIVDGVVKPSRNDVEGQSPDLPVLAAKENNHVLYAGLNRNANLAAFVRQTSPGADQTLVIERAGSPARTATKLTRTADAGRARPAWIPGVDALLVAWDGKLWSVNGNADARVISTALGPVTTVSIAPDGRRVALIAGGKMYVAQLTVTGGAVGLSGQPQQVTVPGDPSLTPAGVAWRSEGRLYVVGTSNGQGRAWTVTIDGVVATDMSSSLQGVVPTDVVASPEPAYSITFESHIIANNKVYKLTDPNIVPEKTMVNPFYVT